MKKRFIPVEVYVKNNKGKIWYIDVGDMSYSQLINLKQELLGTMSIRCIDRVMSDNIGESYRIYDNKQRKRDGKNNNKVLLKRKSKFKRGR